MAVNLHTDRTFWWRGVRRHQGDDFSEQSNYWARVINHLRLTETAGGGAPEWLPEGAVAFLDFTTGHYYAGGIVAFSDVILGGTVDENGLIVQNEVEQHTSFIGSLLAAFALPLTIVTKISNPGASPVNLIDMNTADPNAYVSYGSYSNFMTTDDGSAAYLDAFMFFDGAVEQSVAATFSASKIAASVNGAAVVVDDSKTLTIGVFTEVTLRIGSWTGHIKEIVIYPAKADADLPALSALS